MAELPLIEVVTPTSRNMYRVSSDQRVSDIVAMVLLRIPHRAKDDYGREVEHTFYIYEAGQYRALPRHMTLAEAQLPSACELYLDDAATPKGPWGEPPAVIPPSREKTPSPPTRCEIELLRNCVVAVPESGIQIDRAYLLSHLPPNVVRQHEIKQFMGMASPLNRVARGQHCRLSFTNEGWKVDAQAPIYVNRVRFAAGKTALIRGATTTIVLGRQGWPIEVRLRSI